MALEPKELTKREYFSALFMQQMIVGEGAVMLANRDQRYDETNWKEICAMNAIEFADELIKQLRVNPKKTEAERICAFCGWRKYDHRGKNFNCYDYSDQDTDYFYKDRVFKESIGD